jgi:Fic family protein
MWIYEHQNWPNFTWDSETLLCKLVDIRNRQGHLLGRMEGLGFELKQEAGLITLTNDIVKSSAIEGENLNPMRCALLSPRAKDWMLRGWCLSGALRKELWK